MIVAQVCTQTIQLKRALDCPGHEWVKINSTEDQCSKCGVIATAEGKEYLANIRKREALRCRKL